MIIDPRCHLDLQLCCTLNRIPAYPRQLTYARRRRILCAGALHIASLAHLTAPSAIHLTTCFLPDSQPLRFSVRASLPLSSLQRFSLLNLNLLYHSPEPLSRADGIMLQIVHEYDELHQPKGFIGGSDSNRYSKPSAVRVSAARSIRTITLRLIVFTYPSAGIGVVFAGAAETVEERKIYRLGAKARPGRADYPDIERHLAEAP